MRGLEAHHRITRVIRLIVIAALRFILRLETLQAGPAFDHVPSTVKCSSDNPLPHAKSSTAAKNSSAISPRNKRSRFLLKVVASQTTSSMFSPTNQRDNMLQDNW